MVDEIVRPKRLERRLAGRSLRGGVRELRGGEAEERGARSAGYITGFVGDFIDWKSIECPKPDVETISWH